MVFNEVWHGDPFLDELSDDIKELFNVRNYYLDTSDENKCNWMIHVDIAKYSNDQNLMAYQVSLNNGLYIKANNINICILGERPDLLYVNTRY